MSAQTASSHSEAHHQRQQSYVAAPSSKPPVSLPSSAHLDPNAAIRGTYQITIGQNAVIHPRCQLYSDHGPLTIGENTLISEKCIIGGAPATKESTKKPTTQAESNTASLPQLSDDNNTLSANETHDAAQSSNQGVNIGHHVHIYPAVHINYPSTVSAFSVLESNVVISPSVSIGQHCKICANITVPSGTNIPDYTVVYGDSNHPQRRRRQPQDVAEEGRLKVLDREREGSMLLLRQTALKSLSSGSARKK